MPTHRACPVCASAKDRVVRRYTSAGVEMTAVICETCGLIRNDPVPSEEEKLRAVGGSLAQLHRPAGILLRNSLRNARRYLSGFPTRLPRGAALLDVGCGDGSLLHLAAQRGMSVLGVDTDPEASRLASEFFGVKVLCGRAEELDFEESSFDIVCAAHTLEHLDDPCAFLNRARRVLKPHGFLFIEVPNVLRPKTSAQRIWGLQHCFHFCPESLMALLVRNEWTPVAVTVFFRDSFQVVAQPGPCPDPFLAKGADWKRVCRTIRRHRWLYKLTGQFCWRKLPVLGNLLMHGLRRTQRFVHSV